jgi:hypothetical protein
MRADVSEFKPTYKQLNEFMGNDTTWLKHFRWPSASSMETLTILSGPTKSHVARTEWSKGPSPFSGHRPTHAPQ